MLRLRGSGCGHDVRRGGHYCGISVLMVEVSTWLWHSVPASGDDLHSSEMRYLLICLVCAGSDLWSCRIGPST